MERNLQPLQWGEFTLMRLSKEPCVCSPNRHAIKCGCGDGHFTPMGYYSLFTVHFNDGHWNPDCLPEVVQPILTKKVQVYDYVPDDER